MKNKRIVIAAAAGVIAILIGITAAVVTDFIADNIIEEAEKLHNEPADPADVELFQKQWKKYERILSCYTRHSEVENIGSSVAALDTLIEEDESLYRIECRRVITAAEHLRHTEMPYLSNIL